MNTLVWLVLCLQESEAPAPRAEPPKPQEKEVVVIGQRREGDVLDVPSAVTVVTGEQIRRSGATNVAEVVQRQAGFFMQSQVRDGYDVLVDVRGYLNGAGNGQRTLVLVDGRRTNNVANSSTDWASIPLGNVERIEIVRGPAAALYGDAALAGVVNIITRKPGKPAGDKVVHVDASAAGGNWGTARAYASLGGSAEGALVDIYAGAERTGGWRDHSDYSGRNAIGRVEAPLGGGLTGTFKVGHHGDSRERPGSLTRSEMALLGRDGSVRTGEGEFEENYLDAGLRQSLGDLGEASLFVNSTWWTSWQWDDAWAFEIDDESSVNSLQLKHVVTPKLFSREAAFTTGLDLSLERADGDSGSPLGTTQSDYRRRLLGIYTHAEIRPLDFLSATASVRYDRALMDLDRHDSFSGDIDDSRAFDQFSPHAGITARLVEEISLYASWGRTFKYPRRDELIGFTTFDPQLDPERANVYETGVRLRSGTWGSASVTGYFMRVKDEIFYDPDGGPMGWGSNLNFEEVVHQGVETEARFTPWEGIELFGTYTYTRTVITDADPDQEGKSYPVTPRHAASAGATLRFEGVSFTVTGRYAGERYLVNDFVNEGEELPPHLVYDARISYTWGNVTAFVSAYNLTDREYYDSGGISFGGNRFNPAPERSWMAGGEIRF
jgi:iron complex outermembrane receptor protein